jgi:hypothetical protein
LHAKRSNVSKADAQAKKRYRPAQQGFDTELHARLHRRPRTASGLSAIPTTSAITMLGIGTKRAT